MVARAKVLTEDLLEVVRAEHAKVKTIIVQQQAELHQAQLQYAYNAYAVCITFTHANSYPFLQMLHFVVANRSQLSSTDACLEASG